MFIRVTHNGRRIIVNSDYIVKVEPEFLRKDDERYPTPADLPARIFLSVSNDGENKMESLAVAEKMGFFFGKLSPGTPPVQTKKGL